jgi:hypothetical protein
MKTVIIGIHGLRNKPPRYILSGWWKKSIQEGFGIIKLPVPRFLFEMAYWAQYMHPHAQDESIKDMNDPRYMWEPYVPGGTFGPRDPQPFRKQISNSLNQQILKLIAGKTGFMNSNTVSDIILHRMFIELEVYYYRNAKDEEGRTLPARDLIRNELASLIRRHKDKQICILAHSMGCIIAYDVMMHTVPEIPIHTFMTFGSPMGFPVILKNLKKELRMNPDDDAPLPAPPSITNRWLNFSDPDDVTCMNYNLRNHYRENTNGVRPFDLVVYNNYEFKGTKNPHKIYGYLRAAEFTQALNNFLVIENAGVLQRMKWVFKRPRT